MSELLVRLAVESSIRAAVLVAMVAVILALFRIRSSGTRHAAWTVALVAMLLMPVLTRIVPAIHVPARVPVPDALGPLVPAPPPLRIDTPLPSLPPSLTSGATALPVRPPDSDPADEPVSPVQWDVIGLVVYLTGVTFFLARFAIGLYRLSGIYKSSRRAPISGETAWESAFVATPVTIGLLAPRVILPGSWLAWSPEMLAAVLAHERAHAARRDPLIAVIARLNLAVFWFHPLAWWLERRLATLAEHACDDAALTKVTRRQYADTLLDIAATVRRHQGRLVWQGVGVDGDGRLGARIDRVLSGTSWPQASRTRRALVATSCAVVIAIAVACQQEKKVEPLREDPAVALKLKPNVDRNKAYWAARDMSVEEAAALEKALDEKPEDAAIREKLLLFYQWTGKNKLSWDDNVVALRRHALWLVQHHPDSDLVWRVAVTKQTDPWGYAQLRTRWLALVAHAKVDSAVISNAAQFFAPSDARKAEELLLRGRASSSAEYAQQWATRLGELYALAIVPPSGRIDPEIAGWAQQRLANSSDAAVLLRAGQQLFFSAPQFRELGRSYVERAGLTDGPSSQRARDWLRLVNAPRDSELFFKGAPSSEWPRLVAKSSGVLKVRQLAMMAANDYLMAEYYDWRAKQPASSSGASPNVGEDKRLAAEGFGHAKEYARQAVELAPSLTGPGVGEAAFGAHHTFGLVLLREGDKRGAVDQLRVAAQLPAPKDQEAVGLWSSGLEYKLVFYLLKNGERQTIIDYLERAAQSRTERAKQEMLKSAAAIREGRMPEHYQRLVATGSI